MHRHDFVLLEAGLLDYSPKYATSPLTNEPTVSVEDSTFEPYVDLDKFIWYRPKRWEN